MQSMRAFNGTNIMDKVMKAKYIHKVGFDLFFIFC